MSAGGFTRVLLLVLLLLLLLLLLVLLPSRLPKRLFLLLLPLLLFLFSWILLLEADKVTRAARPSVPKAADRTVNLGSLYGTRTGNPMDATWPAATRPWARTYM